MKFALIYKNKSDGKFFKFQVIKNGRFDSFESLNVALESINSRESNRQTVEIVTDEILIAVIFYKVEVESITADIEDIKDEIENMKDRMRESFESIERTVESFSDKLKDYCEEE